VVLVAVAAGGFSLFFSLARAQSCGREINHKLNSIFDNTDED
jgi:hypothetical protein